MLPKQLYMEQSKNYDNVKYALVLHQNQNMECYQAQTCVGCVVQYPWNKIASLQGRRQLNKTHFYPYQLFPIWKHWILFFIDTLYEVHVMIIAKCCDTSSYLVNLVHVDEILFFHGYVYMNSSQCLYLENYVNVMQCYVSFVLVLTCCTSQG